MKKWSLALVLSMAILAGCGSNQSSAQTTEANVEVKDNRTETEKSGGSGSTVVDNRQKKETASAMSSKSVSDEDFEKTGYIYENSIGDSLYFYIVKNNSAATVEINGNATAYDSAGSVIGASQREIDVLGPGETSLMVFYFDSVSGIDKVDCTLSYDTKLYYKPVINNIRMEQTINDKNITIRATNDGEYNAQFVEAYALFFDSDGKVIAYDSKYVTDNDSEIKPGATLSKQITAYEPFDKVEVFFTGRKGGI